METAEAIVLVKGHVEHELLLRNEYLAAENEILRSRIEGRLVLTKAEKVRLARLGKDLGRKALGDIGCIVTPDTILKWYRELVAKKFDGSETEEAARPPAHGGRDGEAGLPARDGEHALGLQAHPWGAAEAEDSAQ